MEKNIRQFYRVEKSTVQKSYERQMGLKLNPEYEQWANNTAVQLIEYFLNKYSGVKIEIPKLREKSSRSLLGKIKNLQIERLSKLYAINEITSKDKKELYSLIKERINENKDLDARNILPEIENLIYGNQINIDSFEEEIMVDGISDSTKTALLRMLVSKIEKVEYDYKQRDLQYLSLTYGQGLAQKVGLKEKNLIKYEAIQELKENPEKVKMLKNENKFLKANDLRGMKMIVVELPDNFETDNEEIKQLLEKRKLATTHEEKRRYTRLAIVELGKDFYNSLENDEEFLEKTNIQVLPESRKHKNKQNGYEAEHIKFFNEAEPEYTLEMQFKSEDVENLTRGNGSASHENRPGKLRILPHANNDKELVEKINFMVPKYTTFRIKNGYVVPEKQSMLNNVMAYFQDQIDVNSEEYKKIMELYPNEKQQIAM